jgi:hypothetical protein
MRSFVRLMNRRISSVHQCCLLDLIFLFLRCRYKDF